MNAINRMSPPHAGHSSGNSSPTRAMSFAHAIREVSCDRGLSECRSSPRGVTVVSCVPAGTSPRLPMLPTGAEAADGAARRDSVTNTST